MIYPKIIQPITDRDQELSLQVVRQVEKLDMKKQTMIIVGMICDDTMPKKWTLELSDDNHIPITVGTYQNSPYDPNAWTETFADFTIDDQATDSRR